MAIDFNQERRVINDPNASIADKVAAAATLWAFIEEAQKTIETFKGFIRPLAVATKDYVVVYNGTGMTQCRVVLPSSTLRLNEGVSIEGERARFGSLFPKLYNVTLGLYSVHPDYYNQFPPNIASHMAGVTTLVPSTPRVSLRILQGVEELP